MPQKHTKTPSPKHHRLLTATLDWRSQPITDGFTSTTVLPLKKRSRLDRLKTDLPNTLSYRPAHFGCCFYSYLQDYLLSESAVFTLTWFLAGSSLIVAWKVSHYLAGGLRYGSSYRQLQADDSTTLRSDASGAEWWIYKSVKNRDKQTIIYL